MWIFFCGWQETVCAAITALLQKEACQSIVPLIFRRGPHRDVWTVLWKRDADILLLIFTAGGKSGQEISDAEKISTKQ